MSELTPASDLFSSGEYKPRYDTLTLPVSGKTVRIRSLSELELEEYQMSLIGNDGQSVRRTRLADATRRLIVLCLVDGAGNRICNENHVAKLAAWDGADVQYLGDACSKHCGLNRKELENLVKNSETIRVEDSPTA